MNKQTNNELRIHEDLIMVNETVSSKEEIIRKLGALLFDQGYVKDSYIQAVLDREIVYPTGLKARVTGVAVPHTDTEHVNKPAVAIATLKEPVVFQGMGMPDVEVTVYIVMMLAIHHPKLVVETLRKVILVLEDDESMKKLMAAESALEIKQVMQAHIQAVTKKK